MNTARTPGTSIVGLPDAAVKESIERVRAAILNSGFHLTRSRATINLAPATVRKEGPVYDLPIAVALLQSGGTIRPPDGNSVTGVDEYLIAGEVALDGRLRPIRGAISLAQLAGTLGKRGVIVPRENAAEAAVVDKIEVLGATCLSEVVAMFNGCGSIEPHPWVDMESLIAEARPEIDFSDVRGQETAKRAITIAAAGGHNLLMIGPAGTGKTMMARALPGVLPPLSRAEAVEVTRIYSSVGGLARRRPLKALRPVRAPHHTASAAAIVGGGSVPRPGDVSLAHRGVLFLDELPEFSRPVLESLRQPIETGEVVVARAAAHVRYPARFLLAAAMNPCRCGYLTDATRACSRAPRCGADYTARLSGPLIDRFDIRIEVPPVTPDMMSLPPHGENSARIGRRVVEARAAQSARMNGARLTNGELEGEILDRVATPDAPGLAVLRLAAEKLRFTARGYHRVLRLARTLADLEGTDGVRKVHVAEAIGYRRALG